MILLTKLDEPDILAANAARWTDAIKKKLAVGAKPTAAEKAQYNHPEIKKRLVEETSGKCAYCESKVRHVSPGDIEHVVPKSVDNDRWFDWSNLTLACSECNRRKGNDIGALIDPYVMDPEQHLVFQGALVWPFNGSPHGIYTESLLELNRQELFEQRLKRLKQLLRHLDVIQMTSDVSAKDALRRDFARELASDREYLALSRVIYDDYYRKGVLLEGRPS